MNMYIGNGAYCYANTTSMLLHAIDEPIMPSTIEVLSGVSLGALWSEKDEMMFFSNGIPNVGVTRALTILGFTFSEKTDREIRNDPMLELCLDIDKSPVLIGPLDMGHLSYLPNSNYLGGCDHYVLAFRHLEDEIFLHDPAGYPLVSLSFEQLKKAWSTKNLSYPLYARDIQHRYWASPIRINHPSRSEINKQAIQYFKTIYQNAEAYAHQEQGNLLTGQAAIVALSEYLKKENRSEYLIGHLKNFAFQVGSRRAIDFAHFFKGYNDSLANIKWFQAEIFGECHCFIMQDDWKSLGNALNLLAEYEDQFHNILQKC